jgi:hypothetical protein
MAYKLEPLERYAKRRAIGYDSSDGRFIPVGWVDYDDVPQQEADAVAEAMLMGLNLKLVEDASMLAQLRERLLDLISATSEDRWAAGWMSGIERDLYSEGGLWEALGRVVGWPTQYRGGWMTWDEAGEYFRSTPYRSE